MSAPAPNAPHRPRRRLRSVLLILIALGLVGGAGTEIFLRRQYGFGSPPIQLSDPAMEYRYAPSSHYLRRGNRLDFNAFSMRSDEFPATKTMPGERRVIVIGDSVVNGGAQTDQSQLATAILQERLRTALGVPLFVGNVSAGSWGPQNLLGYVKRFGLFEADVVVIVLSSHDATDEINAPMPKDERIVTPTYTLALQEAAERFLTSLPAAGEPGIQVGRAEPCLAAFDELLVRVRSSNAIPIVVFHDERAELDQADEPKGHAMFREVCARHGISPVMLKPAFRVAMSAGQALYRDQIHPTVAGQLVLADVLTPLVESALRSTTTRLTTHPTTRP